MSIIILSLLLITPAATVTVADFAKWVPDQIRYCEALASTATTTPLMGGVTCGATSYYAMTYNPDDIPLVINSTITLGLINVSWLTTYALTTQKSFYTTCKSSLVRLFDGLYRDTTKACAFTVNPPTGLPNCTETAGNLYYRSGSGYCMKTRVCGASQNIDFLQSADNSSTIYSWEPARTTALVTLGYKKVGNCYGYKKLSNPTQSDTTINTDIFF